jgi:hypothetical protein
MRTFWEAAVEKVLRGQTSLEEILKYIPNSLPAEAEPVRT